MEPDKNWKSNGSKYKESVKWGLWNKTYSFIKDWSYKRDHQAKTL